MMQNWHRLLVFPKFNKEVSIEMVKMWIDYFKALLNSENSANGSAESVEHSIDSKENYMGLEILGCSFVSLTSLLQRLPLNKAPRPDCISAEHLLYADESLLFLSVNCLICALFTGMYPILVWTQQQLPYAKTRMGICLRPVATGRHSRAVSRQIFLFPEKIVLKI